MHNLSDYVQWTRISSARAGATADVTSAFTDLQGYEGVSYLVGVTNASSGAALTAAFGAHIEMSETSSTTAGTTVTDIANSFAGISTDSIANQTYWLITEAYRPRYQWVRCVVERSSTEEIIDGWLIAKWKAGIEPVTQSTAYVGDVTSVVGSSGGATG